MSTLGRFMIVSILSVVGITALSMIISNRHGDRKDIAADVRSGYQYLESIHKAESRYKEANGRFADLSELWGSSADERERAIASGIFDGFRFSSRVCGAGYMVTALPANDGRRVALFLTETGKIETFTRRVGNN